MKCMFWNLRGLANSPTKLALKKLLLKHKPDLCFVSEPWMNIANFSLSWLNKLGMKIFCVNNRGNLQPNLWCFSSKNLNPVLFDLDDQQISVQVSLNGKIFGITGVYASTCHMKRRNLWEKLQNVQTIINCPWCCLGDFNTILGAHEQRSNFRTPTVSMQDFLSWTNSNNLIHLHTRGAAFTWSNGRRGRFNIQRRLDRAICNQDWLNACNMVSCATLTKLRSDHFPLLLEFKNDDMQFVSQFKFLKIWVSHPDCINIVKDSWGQHFVGCPMFVLNQKLKHLKMALKVWNKNTFGDIHLQVKVATEKLDAIQDEIDNLGVTDDLMDQEKAAQIHLEKVLDTEETFWHQKSKVNWHSQGDRNTAYFHRIAKIKNATNLITSLSTGDDLLTDSNDIYEHIVNHFTHLFNSNTNFIENGMVEDVIPSLITERINNILISVPTEDEIYQAIFSLNKDSAPGPDGFGALFFQTFWDVVKTDISNAVLQFFKTGWILPNFNSNNIVLIPKTNHAGTVSDYRPIAIANFKFKIISKILADRLSVFMPSIISTQQRGFIKGRSIKDCICLTSEAINVLNKKSFGGNLALKIDIAKAFDTLDWRFLLRVLKCFGFCDKFCKWISTILHSARLSVSINGKLHGFFSCNRGVRQGDPLSPLLFCLAEEVISRSLTKLVREGNLQLIHGTRELNIPSHILYVDDMMVFCKGTNSNINVLKQVFLDYAEASGQVVNPQKSSIFAGSISNHRLNHIANQIGFNIGSLPFTYLGVPIFKGKPKKAYFQPLADKIKLKLSAWKASLLSMAGRVQLIKSVIHSMLLHCLTIYSWPTNLLKELEKWMRNFIWSGDINQRKLVTVSWHKVCKSFKEGGLGIRNLADVNEAGNLKICWEIMQSDLQWAQLVRSRVLRNNKPIRHYVSSSVWNGAKHKFQTIQDNVTWKIGNGENIRFWIDTWCGEPLTSALNIPDHLHHLLQSKLSSYLLNQNWNVPPVFLNAYPQLHQKLVHTTIPLRYKEDKIIWKASHDGNLTFKEAYLFQTSQHPQNLSWAKVIWHSAIPPSKSFLVWRLFHDKLPTDENLIKRGLQFPSVCNLCGLSQETTKHLFLECSFAVNIWQWLSSVINISCNFTSFLDILKIAERNWSPQCRLVILAACIFCLNSIWHCRNQKRFNNKSFSSRSAINLVIAGTSLSGNISNKAASSSIAEFVILKHFDVKINPPKFNIIKEVLWSPPILNWVKCNTDGAASSGKAACGGIYRNADSEFLGAFAINIGNTSALNAELIGAMVAIELAHLKQWHNLWLETDSMLVFLAFKSPNIVPWNLRNRWDNCIYLLNSFRFQVSHIYREGNHCADQLANIGLAISSHFWYTDVPPQIVAEFSRNKTGFPNFRFS